MCFYTSLDKTKENIKRRFKADFETSPWFEQQETINGFTFPKTPVIANNNPEIIQPFSWGLISFWSKDDNIRKYTLNAKIEILTQKPSFRNAINNRCR